MSNIKKTGLELLREPFPENQISKLPKPYSKDSAKGNCKECGGYHGLPAVHLDYVGHAALTDRLLNCDPTWDWQPLALDASGYPVIDKDGGMWIKLTVCGVTRMGYGDAQGKTGGNATKERIGDALRNAAMRFGAALDLWHKGDLHVDAPDSSESIKQEVKHVLDVPANEVTPEQIETLKEKAAEIVDFHTKGQFDDAFVIYDNVADSGERNYLWILLQPNSAVRSKLKSIGLEKRAGK